MSIDCDICDFCEAKEPISVLNLKGGYLYVCSVCRSEILKNENEEAQDA